MGLEGLLAISTPTCPCILSLTALPRPRLPTGAALRARATRVAPAGPRVWRSPPVILRVPRVALPSVPTLTVRFPSSPLIHSVALRGALLTSRCCPILLTHHLCLRVRGPRRPVILGGGGRRSIDGKARVRGRWNHSPGGHGSNPPDLKQVAVALNIQEVRVRAGRVIGLRG